MKHLTIFLFIACLHAENGYDAWLRYKPVPDATLPATVTVLGDSPVLLSARDELIRGARGITGRVLRIEPQNGDIVLGEKEAMKEDGCHIKVSPGHIVIAAANDRGVLYVVFALLRRLEMREPLVDQKEEPRVEARWTNEWNNLNCTIEWGYAGPSIFFEKENVRADLTRAADYARLLASLGINACAVNNVNANVRVIQKDSLSQMARIAAALRPCGVLLAIAIDFGSPTSVGSLDTFDPLDPCRSSKVHPCLFVVRSFAVQGGS